LKSQNIDCCKTFG